MILAASGIILQNKKILLLQRSHYTKNYPEFWGCPGGRAEPNETTKQNVIREVKEECNLNFSPTSILKIGVWKDRNYYRFLGNWNGDIKIQEQEVLKEILKTEFKDECYPLDDLSLTETLPIIKNCDISVCNDSSFSHLSSALGIKTIVLMADTPLLYGSYSPRMYPIIPDGENTVTHDTLGKDRINPNKIFDQLDSILS
jgi:hypothetical protein